MSWLRGRFAYFWREKRFRWGPRPCQVRRCRQCHARTLRSRSLWVRWLESFLETGASTKLVFTFPRGMRLLVTRLRMPITYRQWRRKGPFCRRQWQDVSTWNACRSRQRPISSDTGNTTVWWVWRIPFCRRRRPTKSNTFDYSHTNQGHARWATLTIWILLTRSVNWKFIRLLDIYQYLSACTTTDFFVLESAHSWYGNSIAFFKNESSQNATLIKCPVHTAPLIRSAYISNLKKCHK